MSDMTPRQAGRRIAVIGFGMAATATILGIIFLFGPNIEHGVIFLICAVVATVVSILVLRERHQDE